MKVDQIGGRMTIDPMTVAVAFHQYPVLMPLTGREVLGLGFLHQPALSLGVHPDFLPGLAKNSAAFLLVKHTVVLGFVRHHVALVTRDHVDPQIRSVNAAVLNSAVGPVRYSNPNPQVEVADSGHFPGEKLIHGLRPVSSRNQDTVLL